MLPNFLIPDSTIKANGHGEPLEVGAAQGRAVQLTLGIQRVIEQESLEILVHGSEDGENWIEKPLVHFPQKFYCGTYAVLLDLSRHPNIKVLRATWKANRWGRGDLKPMFGCYLFVEGVAPKVRSMVAGAAR